MGLRAKRMKGLKITGCAGVDKPATGEPWLITKSAGDDDATIDAQIEALIKVMEDGDDGEADVLVEMLRSQMAEWPEAAKSHARALIDTLTADEDPAKEDDDMADATKAVSKTVTDLLAEVSKSAKAAEERAGRAEKALALLSGGTDVAAPTIEEIELTKALETMPEPLRKAWAANQERLAKAEEVAKAERDARLSREYLEKAQGYDGLPAKPEELGTVLREIDEKLSKEAAAEVTRVLRAASEASARSDLLKEYGGMGRAVHGSEGGAWAQIEAKATELQKAEPNLDRAEAVAKAAEQNPDLLRAYDQEVTQS